MNKIEIAQAIVKECHNCELRKEGMTPVPIQGHENSKVVVIGTGPAYYEIRDGVPWVGKVGRFTRKLVHDVGLRSVSWMNAVACSDAPSQEHILACRSNLYDQINATNAKFALLLGAPALSSLHPFRLVLRDVHGLWWKLTTGQWAMATYHPATVYHGYTPQYEVSLRHDLDEFAGSVLLEDLKPPKLSEHCIVCGKWKTYDQQGIPFCSECYPKQKRHKGYTQLNLLEGLDP